MAFLFGCGSIRNKKSLSAAFIEMEYEGGMALTVWDRVYTSSYSKRERLISDAWYEKIE